jgi:hypothetical protein
MRRDELGELEVDGNIKEHLEIVCLYGLNQELGQLSLCSV